MLWRVSAEGRGVDGFGDPVYTVYDQNYDGFSDIVIDVTTKNGRSEFWLFHGSENADTIPDVDLYRNVPRPPIGDINGDGVIDLGSSRYIYFGPAELDSTPYQLPFVEINGEKIGHSSPIRDFNGDEFDDILEKIDSDIHLVWI